MWPLALLVFMVLSACSNEPESLSPVDKEELDQHYIEATIYAHGDPSLGIQPDPAKAAELFRFAAERGHALAQAQLAQMYHSGEGVVAQDGTEATKWYRLAAEQGDLDSQLALGMMHAEGELVAQDFVKALKWVNIAASGNRGLLGHRDQMANLMSPEQVAEAEALADEWLKQHGSD